MDGRTDHETLKTMMYSLFVDAPTLAVIRTQSAKLASFAESLSTWNSSPYSACLRLVNSATQETLRRFWKFYCSDAYCTPSFYANYRNAIIRTRKDNDSKFAYSIGPLKISLQIFWGFGYQDDELLDDNEIGRCNPLFAYSDIVEQASPSIKTAIPRLDFISSPHLPKFLLKANFIHGCREKRNGNTSTL